MRQTSMNSLWAVSVYAAIRNRTGRILLLHRSALVPHFPSTWELPGGKLENGEDIETALRREIREETGLEVRLHAVAGATGFQIDNRQVVCLVFTGTAKRNGVRLSDDHDSFEWVNPDTLTKRKLAAHFRPVRKWLARKRALFHN